MSAPLNIAQTNRYNSATAITTIKILAQQITGTIIRVGLCFVPQVPQAVADNIFWGILGLFGGNVVSQRVADGMSKGATATVNKE